jgi:hypothetical protein
VRRFLLAVLLAVFGCVTASAAGGITFSTGQSDYTVQVGEEARFPVTVENTLGADITGTFSQSVRFEPDAAPEGSDTATSIQSRPLTVFTGEREMAVSAGAAREPGTYSFLIAFEYSDKEATRIALPEIRVHVVDAGAEQLNLPNPQESTASSIAAPSGSAGSQGPSQPQSDQMPGQLPQDMGLIRDQALYEHDLLKAMQSALITGLEDDPQVLEIHGILTLHGYVRATVTVDPALDGSGTFSLGYRGGSGDTIRVVGSVASNATAYASYGTDQAFVVPDALPANETYRRFADDLAGAGFFPVSAGVNATPDGTFVTVAFIDSGNRTARITATMVEGDVRSVALEEPPDPLPLAGAGAVCIILLIAYLVRQGRPIVPKKPTLSDTPGDPQRDALRLLGEARWQYDGGDGKGAYGTAGRALRSYLSHAYGSGSELADGDVLRLLPESEDDVIDVLTILERCAAVSFARSSPRREEFESIVRDIEAIIVDKVNQITLPEP